MNKKSGNLLKRMMAGLLMVAMTMTMTPVEFGMREAAEAATILSNPRILPDRSMWSGQLATWDCVWFGSYPQREVVADSSQCYTYGKDYQNSDDYILDSDLYNRLRYASYDVKGDTTIDGKKYRRCGDDTCRYFCYEPLKWRVLSTDGYQALLMADQVLDCRKYNEISTDITWENSTLRAWLNDGFYKDAFNRSEQGALVTVNWENTDNCYYGTEAGNDTQDKVVLLSESDVFTRIGQNMYDGNAVAYGFIDDFYSHDEGRRATSTTYAKAMGVRTYSGNHSIYLGNCYWWLRTTGRESSAAVSVNYDGSVDHDGRSVNDYDYGVRPTLTLNLSDLTLWSYAGKVSSDGTVEENVDPNVYAYGTCGADLVWTLYFDGCLMITGTGAMQEYGSTKEVPWNAYKDRITSVVVMDGVETVSPFAFYGLVHVREVNLPKELKTIGAYALKNCTELEYVTMPSKLNRLGESAMMGCSSLKRIVIPEGIYTVWEYTFKNCTSLESVTLPDSLIKLDEAAFYGCSGLTSIQIPDNCSIIDAYCFKNCYNLSDVKLPATLGQLREAVFYATAIPSLDVPDKVTSVGPYAFKRCTALTSISLPANLKTVGESSFYGCTGLTEITLPEGMTEIKDYAYKACSKLTRVNLPETVETLGESAFNTCEALESFVIPASVKTIKDYCFSGDGKLKNIAFQGNAPAIGVGAFKNVTSKAYYPASDMSWTSDVTVNYGGDLTWICYLQTSGAM